MFCTQCGTPLKESQKFCTNCGARPETEDTVLPRTTSQPSRSATPPVTTARVPASTSSSAPAIAMTSAEPLASAAAVEAPRPVAVAALAPSTISPKPGELEKSIGPSTVSRFLPWVLAALAIVVVVGALLFYRFSTSPRSVSDADIIHSIQTRFAADPDLSKCTVEVKSLNGIVTLTGLVNKESDKTSAASTAGQQPGVKQVNIYGLVVSAPISPSTGGETAGSNSATGSVKTVTVPGNEAWTATGVFLNAGVVVTISASGGVSMGGGLPLMPPSGRQPDCGNRAGFPAAHLPCWSLIGRVGEAGTIFYVGSATTVRVPREGELFLGVNDDQLGDNSGNWNATVRVLSGAAQDVSENGDTVRSSESGDAKAERNCSLNNHNVYISEVERLELHTGVAAAGVSCGSKDYLAIISKIIPDPQKITDLDANSSPESIYHFLPYISMYYMPKEPQEPQILTDKHKEGIFKGDPELTRKTLQALYIAGYSPPLALPYQTSNANAQASWFGFANGNVAQDRDAELRRNCGDFDRVYVPDNAGNKFPDLCGYVGKTCKSVCDWEGRSISCDTVSQGGNRDGTRVAMCR